MEGPFIVDRGMWGVGTGGASPCEQRYGVKEVS